MSSGRGLSAPSARAVYGFMCARRQSAKWISENGVLEARRSAMNPAAVVKRAIAAETEARLVGRCSTVDDVLTRIGVVAVMDGVGRRIARGGADGPIAFLPFLPGPLVFGHNLFYR